jgi:hypothetical protein
VIASMMGVGARQASWINSAIKKRSPWNTAFEVSVYVLLSISIREAHQILLDAHHIRPNPNPPLPLHLLLR